MISCLMVTLAGPQRMDFVKRSVGAYLRQTHKDRELVVVTAQPSDQEFADLAAWLATLDRPDITVHRSGPATLGALRNVSLAKAHGEIVCQWDDDDIFHPDRLSGQLAALEAGTFGALYLSDVLQYFPSSGALYWTNWRATEIGGHPGTLMARRSQALRYPEDGPSSQLGEDLELARGLSRQGRVGLLEGQPHLFVYVSHGRNTWPEQHHAMLAAELSISQGLLRRKSDVINAELSALDFGGAPVHLTGRTAP